MSHPVKLFDAWTERVNNRNVQRSAPLGVLALEHEPNKERRKTKARALAVAHVGREPTNVSHSLDDSIVVTFRRVEVSVQ
jgi:hypothetical protein